MRLNSFWVAITLLLLIFSASGPSFALSVGQQAPGFNLIDTQGQTFGLFQFKDRPMTILYFFDVDSQSSQEGLLSLAHLVKQYPDIDMEVLGITLSVKDRAVDFVAKTQPGFPVLLDDLGMSDQYNARKILPSIYILGPGFKVLEVIQGGGKATEVMLMRLAERTLQRNKTKLAQTVSEQLIQKDPENLDAINLNGYAAMKEGNLDLAEKTFLELVEKKGQGEVLGKEGLVMVYARKGEDKKALALAKEVEEMAPERAFIHVVRGDVLYRHGNRAEAAAEYQKAVAKREADLYQKALALNQLGRIEADKGNYQKARQLYDQAVEIDPYYVEALTNKGISYEKEGRWEDALLANRKALAIEKQDTFASVLARNAEKMLNLEKDNQQNERIDSLVRELTERYQNQRKTSPEDEDSWTSGPMVMTFIDFQEKGGLAEQDGLATVLSTQLGDLLDSSGRVKVVERALVSRILAELNIGTSALADSTTALQVGRILAAKLIATGSLFYLPEKTLLTLRLVDTETSAIQKVFTLDLEPQTSLDQELFRLNRGILSTVMQKYPLQGYVVENTNEQLLINLGEKQGVVQGTTFDVLEESAPKTYQQKILRGSAKVIGQIEIGKVESDLSYARIVVSRAVNGVI